MSISDPTISLIIPTYNRGDLIAETLNSALAQTTPFYEIIVVDDGSSDHTQEVLEAYAGRIKVVTVANGGVQRARNLGVAAARGQYISMCDSDDLMAPDYVDTMVTWLATNPECNTVYSNFVNFDEHGVKPDKFSGAPPQFFAGAQRSGAFWYDIPDLYRRILAYQPLFPSGNIIRRSLYTSIGGYNVHFNGIGAEDFEFALRAVEAGSVALCANPLLRIRRHSANDSLDNMRQVHGTVQILEYALANHSSAVLYREAILASLETRRINVFNNAFARGSFALAEQMIPLLQHPPSDRRFRLKRFITQLPSVLRRPLWRLTQT